MSTPNLVDRISQEVGVDSRASLTQLSLAEAPLRAQVLFVLRDVPSGAGANAAIMTLALR